MQNIKLNQQIQKCNEQFDAESEVRSAEEQIREGNHDSVVDSVIMELDLDDWDGDLETAPRRALREYEIWMEERIIDELDAKLAQQIEEHIRRFFDEATMGTFPGEMDSLKSGLLLKVRHHNLELDYQSLELAGLVYSSELPDSPFMYHQTMWQTDERYRGFIQRYYAQIVTLSQELLHQYRASALGMIPGVGAVVEERWQS